MSNQLSVTYNGTATIYAIIRDSSGEVWNGSDFVPWVDGNLSTYAVSLASVSGDLYTATFPSTIPVGTYTTIYYKRLGASVALTDLILKSRKRGWDGVGLTGSGSVTLSAYALCDENYYKLATGISLSNTDDDDLIRQSINAATSAIEQVTNRKFKARDYVEHLPLYGELNALSNYPVVKVNRVSVGEANAISVMYTGTAIRASIAVVDGVIYLRSIVAGGTVTTNTVTLSSNVTHTSVVNAINAVSGWAATLIADGESAELHNIVASDCLNKLVYLTYPDDDIGDYYVRPDGIFGINYTGFSFQPYSLCVNYRAGYDTIPASLQQLCANIAKRVFKLVSVNPLILEEELGDYKVKYGGQLSAIISEEEASSLKSWSNVVVGNVL